MLEKNWGGEFPFLGRIQEVYVQTEIQVEKGMGGGKYDRKE